MNASLKELSRHYLENLRLSLAEEGGERMVTMDGVCDTARRLGLGAPELAMAHDEAIVALLTSGQAADHTPEVIRLAGTFFRQAIAEFESTTEADEHDSTRPHDPGGMKTRLRNETAKRKDVERVLQDERSKYDRLLAESKSMLEELRLLSHEVLMAQEEERKKISRELHDEISQILTGINVRLAALRIESSANTEHIKEKIASAQRLVEKSVATVHRFARELRPVMLDDLGLIPALTSHLKEVRKRTGLQIRLSTSKSALIEQVDSLKRTVLYRITQEALNNIVKHAKASRVDITVQVDSDHIRLEVADDGTSFSVQDVLAHKRRKRLGLIGMRERAEMVGGIFKIQSALGEGTKVHVQLPLHGSIGT